MILRRLADLVLDGALVIADDLALVSKVALVLMLLRILAAD